MKQHITYFALGVCFTLAVALLVGATTDLRVPSQPLAIKISDSDHLIYDSGRGVMVRLHVSWEAKGFSSSVYNTTAKAYPIPTPSARTAEKP